MVQAQQYTKIDPSNSIKHYINKSLLLRYSLNLTFTITLNSPGLAFIARVFKTSKGCVRVVATAPLYRNKTLTENDE